MSDLDDVFAAYRSGGALATPAGADAARHVAHRRRKAGAIALGVFAAALLATSAVATTRLDRPPPVPPLETVSPVPAPTPTPSTAPPSTLPSSAPPDGRISKAELGNAVLDLPAWPDRLDAECPDGRVGFTGGRATISPKAELRVDIVEVVHADLDGDGAPETGAWITCSGIELGESRVLAFDRDQSGAIVTMGMVVGETGGIRDIRDIRAGGAAIEAQVTDWAGDGVPDDLGQLQWRSYTWSGGRFRQTGGPSSFPANARITDLSIEGVDTMLAPVEGDRALGTLRVTVANHGPRRATEPAVRVAVPKPFDIASVPAGCTRHVSLVGTDVTCRPAALAVGRSINVDLQVSVPLSRVGSGVAGQFTAEVAWAKPDNLPYPEPAGKEKDNHLTADLIVTG
ncbi:MAG: hypothetical protein ABW022_13560 [Actinoplanes sp.]